MLGTDRVYPTRRYSWWWWRGSLDPSLIIGSVRSSIGASHWLHNRLPLLDIVSNEVCILLNLIFGNPHILQFFQYARPRRIRSV